LCREFLQAYDARVAMREVKWTTPSAPTLVRDFTHQILDRAPAPSPATIPPSGDKSTIAKSIGIPQATGEAAGSNRDSPLYHGQRTVFELTDRQSDLVAAISQQESVSPFVIWMSVLQIVLERYAGRYEFLFHIARSGRDSTQRRLVGPFFETLSVAVSGTGKMSLADLLRSNQRVADEMNRVKPHSNMLADSRIGILLDYQSALQPIRLENGTVVLPAEWDNGAALAELCLGIRRDKRRFHGHVKFDLALFEPTAITRFIGHLKQCIENGLAKPHSPIGQIDILTPTEMAIYADANSHRVHGAKSADRAAAEPANSVSPTTSDKATIFESVYEQFSRQANLAPNATAVVCGGRSTTFGQLHAAVCRIGDALSENGVQRGDRVGLMLQRSPALLAGLFATMRVGATFVPIETAWPELRKRDVMQVAGLSCLLTERVANSIQSRTPLLCLDDPSFWGPGPANDNGLSIGSKDSDTAYIMFTSGSTGVPKGVEVSLGNLNNFFAGFDELQAAPGAAGCWLAVSNLSFDISMLELLWTLTRGLTVVILANEGAIGGFAPLADRHRVTHFQCTPALMQMIVHDSACRAALAKIDNVYLGGDVLTEPLARQILHTCRGRVFNLYGPTETTIWSTYWPLRPGPVRIGRPLANQTVYILDSELRQVPLGFIGELFIGGRGVAKGYLQDDVLTMQRFVEHKTWGRLYRTGDLVRMLPEGDLEFVSRNDLQVKRFGHRFELGDVESAARRAPGVTNCVALFPSRNKPQLSIFVCGDKGWLERELVRHLKAHLPKYMFPDRIVVVDELPMNHAGKIDRRAIAELDGREIRIGADQEFQGEEPRLAAEPEFGRENQIGWQDQIHNQIVEILTAELKLQSLPLNKSWSDLGINSLDVVGLVVRLERELQIQFPVADLFRDEPIASTLRRVVSETVRETPVSGRNRLPSPIVEMEEGVI
jgi:amino acid adenylation domain-containing protein